jgi:metal-sulfur cluster biosynthetic enzyme
MLVVEMFEPGLTAEHPLIEAVRGALSVVDDPELGVDIVSLGLVYGIKATAGGVRIVFTLTSMGCPIGPMIEREIVAAAGRVAGVSAVQAELVFDPPCSPERMADEVKFALGFLR